MRRQSIAARRAARRGYALCALVATPSAVVLGTIVAAVLGNPTAVRLFVALCHASPFA